MKTHCRVVFLLLFLIFGTNCYADNYSTVITFDDNTGGIINTSTSTTSGSSSNLFSNLSLTPEQLQQLSAAQSQLQSGQSSGNAVPQSVSSLINSGNINVVSLSQSPSVNPMYKKSQEALMVMPTAIQVSGYMNQLNSYDEAFHNTDMLMMMSKKDRIAYKFANRYAFSDNSGDYGHGYSPTIIYSQVKRSGADCGLWVRPYVSTGSTNFKNGFKVNNTLYGVYVGGDSSMKHLKNSDFQYSVYAGYNGSHESYGVNSSDSHGGLLGVTGTWYGENSFASLTVNAGANNAELQTQFMNRDYPMFTTGVAGKAGYNFEFADGKFIVQPSYMMSYSFVTPFEKGKVYGMKIDSKPLNVMNISPGIKLIGNFEHGWQPYAEARMVWNLFDKTDYSTALVDIPSISIKPYAQYGVGLQKLWGERSTGYIQFTMRSGGRNDIAFNAGYRYDFGD